MGVINSRGGGTTLLLAYSTHTNIYVLNENIQGALLSFLTYPEAEFHFGK